MRTTGVTTTTSDHGYDDYNEDADHGGDDDDFGPRTTDLMAQKRSTTTTKCGTTNRQGNRRTT